MGDEEIHITDHHHHHHHRHDRHHPYKPIHTTRFPLKDLYVGLMQDVAEKQKHIKEMQAHLERHTKATEALRLEIESVRAEITNYDEQKCQSDMRLLQHRRELRVANLAGTRWIQLINECRVMN